MALIYKITNQINHKVYIGKTSFSLEKRFKEHCDDSIKPRQIKRPLYDAMNKYGINNFSIEALEEGLSDAAACEREIYWIKYFNSYVGFENSNGYNATLGGDSRHYYDYQALADAYQNLQSVQAVCDLFNCDSKTVQIACKECGVKIKFMTSVKCVQNQKERIFNSIAEAAKTLFPDKKVSTASNGIQYALRHSKTHLYGGYYWYFT